MAETTVGTGRVCSDCGTVLSKNGIGWVRQGYRLNRRNIDGTPTIGAVHRPDSGPDRAIWCLGCAKAKAVDLR